MLQTSPDWLLYMRGPEEVKIHNPAEEIASLVQMVEPDRLGVVVALLRRLAESKEDAA